MEKDGNSNRSGRILVLVNLKWTQSAQLLCFLEKLKQKYPLRICKTEEKPENSENVWGEGWRTELPERVLENIQVVFLAGMTGKLLDSLENGDMEEPEVQVLTLCFLNKIPVYLWEEHLWKEGRTLPVPVQRIQDKKKKVCEMYQIRFLDGQQLEKASGHIGQNQKKSQMYTMEDVEGWSGNVVVEKGAYFTPLAKDYLREKKISVEYQ